MQPPTRSVDWASTHGNGCIWQWRPLDSGTQALYSTPRYEQTHNISNSVRSGTCQLMESHSGVWYILRFGAFASTGGYDWTDLTVDDLIQLSGIMVSASMPMALHANVAHLISAHGEPVPLPPLHLHHFEHP